VPAKTASKSRPRSPSPTNSSKKQRFDDSVEARKLQHELGL